MASKRKFKRDYIILEAKDMNFRYKERVVPKAFAKVEVNEEKSTVALYVENVKSVKDGYKVVVIRSDYDTVDLGNIVVSDQGKGEFVFDLANSDSEIKGIAMLHDKTVPLIGFKGSKIDNYEEILFTGDDDYEDNEYYDNDEYEYEEIEYIEVDEDDPDYDGYEEIEYIEIDEDDPDYDKYEDGDEYHEYEEIDNLDEYDKEDDDIDISEPTDSIVEDEMEDEIENIINTTRKKVPENNNGIGNALKKPIQKQSLKTNSNLSYEQRKSKVSSNQTNHNSNVKQSEKVRQSNLEINHDELEQKTAGSLLMPRQIKKGLKMFREVKPFINEPTIDTRWWKIEISPTTLCGYTMPHLGYINTLNYTMYSDTVMNSYKYRHYLFGVQYDEYNKRKNYVYAIPGAKNEQPDKGLTGFRTYHPCDDRNDNIGYWLCFIDSRTRRIVK